VTAFRPDDDGSPLAGCLIIALAVVMSFLPILGFAAIYKVTLW
jgi:hypothetical protein